MSNGISEAGGCFPLPLCRRYLFVLFDSLFVPVQGEGVVHQKALHWAAGSLADGQLQVLGVWQESVAGEAVWQTVFEDLTAGGVESVRFVEGIDASAVGPRLHTLPLKPSFIPSMRNFIRQIEDALTAREIKAVGCSLAA